MALLLIKVTGHWMDKLTSEEVQARADKDPGFLDSYNARYQKGDVVEVRKDNAPFGRKEQLPNFLVVKVEGKKADHLHLMEPDTEILAAEKDQEPEERLYTGASTTSTLMQKLQSPGWMRSRHPKNGL